jgi:hypothetical protein
MEKKNYVIAMVSPDGKTFAVFKSVKSFIKHYYLFYEAYGITESMIPKISDIEHKLEFKHIVEIIGNKDTLLLKRLPLY